ncbi:alginate export family protein, partial [Aquidulcibacter sp.]|uniref:alginate export family protein n=1 Tax=Aquidulcibacter sp. TaxID=2052990 RepID=UPI0025C45C13
MRHLLAASAALTFATLLPDASQAQATQKGSPTVTPERILPDWLSLSGESRVRYESLDGQFRAGGRGGDQALAFRTLILAEAKFEPVTFGLELQDSRKELNDTGSTLSASLVNPLDVLQAYASIDLSGTGLANALKQDKARLKLGRQTLDIGGRRILERADMANVLLNFTGAYWQSSNARGDAWNIVAVVPVGRLPQDRASLEKNEMQADREEWSRLLLGVHYRRANLLGELLPDTSGELFVFRLKEHDTTRTNTPNRDYLQPGFRLFKPPKKSQWDFELDTSWRTGTRRASNALSDTIDLKVRTFAAHAHIGYTFDAPWQPRIGLDWDFASGDSNPNDLKFEQAERLFGGRRTDLGNTGIHGPLTPANINAAGGRIDLKPNARSDMRLAFKLAHLDEARDAWVVARVQDRTGQSGTFIG